MWWCSELLKRFIDEKKQLSCQTSLFFRTEDRTLSDTIQDRVTAGKRLTEAML